VNRQLIVWIAILFCFGLPAQKALLLPDTLRICIGDSTSLELRNLKPGISSIDWNTPYGIITNTNRVKILKGGIYTVRVTGSGYNKPVFDTSVVIMLAPPRKLLRDTLFCKGRTVRLDAGNSGLRFLWNTGESSQRITVSRAGLYTVRISGGGCSIVDSVMVKQLGDLATPIATETVFCMHDDAKTIGVKLLQGASVTWNTGNNTPTIQPPKEGKYWVTSKHPVCGKQTDTILVKFKACECEMMVPNSFTPNEDGKNDTFSPILQCEYSYYLLTVADRWGNVVFIGNHTNAKWDGKYKGNWCPEDVYIYKIESIEKGTDKKLLRTGRVSLFR